MKKTNRDRQGGFALIESIAVLVLSGLVLTTLLIAGDLVTRKSASTARYANQIEALATGTAAFRRDLDSVLYARGSGEEAPVLFHGEPRALGLAVTETGAGESLLWFAARYDNERGVLVRSSAALLPQTGGFADASFANPVVLFSGPWTYRFSYAAVEAGALRWAEAWTDTAKLPAAVRLEVLDRTGARPIVPPLVVALKVDKELVCQPSEGGGCGGGEAESGAEGTPPEEGTPPGEEGTGDGSTEGQ